VEINIVRSINAKSVVNLKIAEMIIVKIILVQDVEMKSINMMMYVPIVKMINF
jgi:hypothetical protein